MEGKIKTFEEACQLKGYDPEKVLPDVSGFPEKHRKSLWAFAKLIIIAEALNGDWKPDWNDRNQEKWEPWFWLNKPGFRLDDADYGASITGVGSRLCYESEELALYAGEQFIDLYRDWMVVE